MLDGMGLFDTTLMWVVRIGAWVLVLCDITVMVVGFYLKHFKH